jgi:hypothetical protein
MHPVFFDHTQAGMSSHRVNSLPNLARRDPRECS